MQQNNSETVANKYDQKILKERYIFRKKLEGNVNKMVIFKNYGPFIKPISAINNTQVDDAHGSNANL